MERLARIVVVGYVVITFISVIITYCFSILLDHNNPFLPTLSLLGNEPLESTIFTQCFVVDATILMVVVQLKFVHVYHNLIKLKASKNEFKTNLFGVYAGYLSGTARFILFYKL
ncbi:hypothetical protein Phum_PHUM248230 [Pediculus humanus corporis]|uniref:CWH43-like N-terminal domain-containing protein n=1 Tax=Pediculus humanus subsp. corporis TaxID=121224 RepID=E0VJN4_PEDHC|nr:uncharacterized protein Phum_PHUM248230 [Pediculus humanus corporis]EEB13590.1 hypothetical protein Phum_PHUM248230 [Pediculus humanus corporis]